MEPSPWQATRDALEEVLQRFERLLADVGHAEARAIGKWTIGDVSAHVHEVSILNSLFVTGAEAPGDWRDLYEMATSVNVDRVGDLNALALAILPERSPQVLAGRIAERVALMLDATAAGDGDE